MMIVLAVLVQGVACYCFYNSAQRAVHRSDQVSVWLQNHPRFSLIAGIVFLIISCWWMLTLLGMTVGLFCAFLSLMTLMSLSVVLIPLTTKKN